MSWKSGSTMMDDIIIALKEKIDDDLVREEVYSALIDIFQLHGCDTLDECYGVDTAFDSALDDASFDLDEDEDEFFEEDEDYDDEDEEEDE